MFKLLNNTQSCYQRVRTIVKKLNQLKSCINWLKAYEQLIQSNDSDLLQQMALYPSVPPIIKRRSQITIPIDMSIHNQPKMEKKYGGWIKAFKKKIADNRVHPCVVCHTLQSKKQVT
jgi:hypothetical protein